MTRAISNTEHRWAPRTANDHALLAVRNLVMDMCMQNGGGHGGSALGMAAIGVALWKYTMRYNPENPDWFDRDRFVLSNGKFGYYCIGSTSHLSPRSCEHVFVRNEPPSRLRQLDNG